MSAEERNEKATKALEAQLEPGEVVRAAVVGMPGGVGGPIRAAATGYRVVAITDRHVYVLKTAQFRPWKPKEVLAKHRLGDVEVTASGSSLTVGDQDLSSTELGWKQQVNELVAAAASPAS